MINIFLFFAFKYCICFSSDGKNYLPSGGLYTTAIDTFCEFITASAQIASTFS